MIRQLYKNTSSPKLSEIQPIIATSPSNKFQRTTKKLSNEETNFTSEKSQSIISKSSNKEKGYISPRSNHMNKLQGLNSQLEDGIPSSIIKTQLESTNSARNFMKKNTLSINIQSILSPSTKTKTVISPKYQKNKTQSIVQQERKNQIEDRKIVLKKSVSIFYLISRIYKSKLKNCFRIIGENKQKIKLNQKQRSILAYQAAEFWKRLQKKLKLQSINRFKLITAKKGRQTFVFQIQFIKINNQKCRNHLPNFLNIIQRYKIGGAFQIIKKNMVNKRLISKVYPTLFDFYERRKIRNAFELFKRSSKLTYSKKVSLFNQLQASFKMCSKNGLSKAFKRILLHSSKIAKDKQQIVEQSEVVCYQDNKVDQIKLQIQQNQKQIKMLQQKVSKQQQNQQSLAKKSNKQTQDLRKLNQQLIDQSNKKKINNEQMKQQRSQVSENLDEKQEDKGSNKILLLQQLYCQIYKQPEENLTSYLQQIINSHKIDPAKENPILKEWLLIQQKIVLQQQIDHYQNYILGSRNVNSSNIGKILRQQSQMIRQMIKNYIKQRYLWGQVQKFVRNVL